jgi:hypothetical protein
VLLWGLVGFLVGLIVGSQEGELAVPRVPSTVTVEKTIPAATPESRSPDTTTARPPDKLPGKSPEKDKPPDTSTATATALP